MVSKAVAELPSINKKVQHLIQHRLRDEHEPIFLSRKMHASQHAQTPQTIN